jgi:hypothetical protein
MLLSRHQNAGKNNGIKTANRSHENVAQFKYLGTTVTNRNLIPEEISHSRAGFDCICRYLDVAAEMYIRHG